MIIRQVKSLVGGETLAEPVITKEKEILISGGTVLKPEYLDLISFLGIDTVCIEDPYEAFETTHLIINEEREKYFKKCRFYACRTNHCNSDYGGACGNRRSDGNSVYTKSAGIECDGRVTYDCVSG